MTEYELLEYLSAFNNKDYVKMATFFEPDVVLELPNNVLEGADQIAAFYENLHTDVRELLAVDFLMIDDEHIALELYTEFRALSDRDQFTFGPLRKGEVYRCTNMVHYDLRNDRYARIRVGRYREWGENERREPKNYPGVATDIEGNER